MLGKEGGKGGPLSGDSVDRSSSVLYLGARILRSI